MNRREVPESIKELIRNIADTESSLRTAWKQLYDYLDKIGFEEETDVVANLQDGEGAEYLIELLEAGYTCDKELYKYKYGKYIDEE